MPYTPSPGHVSVTPSNPTAINSATYLMNGLGVAGANAWVLTPQVTGRVYIQVTGDLVENATAQTATIQLSFGTGSAPANAGALAGTQVGGQLSWISLTGQLTIPFALSWVLTGLSVPNILPSGLQNSATPIWIDVNSKSSAGTIQLTNLNLVAFEF